MVAPRLDWREVGGSRRGWKSVARSDRAAARAEIFAAQSLAHREMDGAGELRFAGSVARGNNGNCKWSKRCGAGTVSFAGRLRTLLYARRAERGICAVDAGGGAAYRARHRGEPRRGASQGQGSTRCA